MRGLHHAAGELHTHSTMPATMMTAETPMAAFSPLPPHAAVLSSDRLMAF